MGKVHVDITTSLDGYIAGPHDGPELPLGENGERIHEWVTRLTSWRKEHGLEGGETNSDSEVFEESLADRGAVILGRRMFDNAHGWGEEPPFRMPVFVLTHEAREPETKQGGTTFTFVNDGIESALQQAKAAAGDKNILVAGGADTVQQFLKAGLIDEIQIHVVPLLLGGGVKLLEGLNDEDVKLESTRVVESPTVAHLQYRVVRD
jgi:dihydrofolate reductase